MYPQSCFEISKDIKEKNLYIVWTVTVCFRIERFLARDAFTHTHRTGQMLSACNFLCTIGHIWQETTTLFTYSNFVTLGYKGYIFQNSIALIDYCPQLFLNNYITSRGRVGYGPSLYGSSLLFVVVQLPVIPFYVP